VFDFFAGSGTTGAACLETGRGFTLVDSNPDALVVMAKRFASETCIAWHGFDPTPYQQEAKQSRLFMPVDEK
jgi:site-specific DNA-methyltransferase (adenine-specific)